MLEGFAERLGITPTWGEILAPSEEAARERIFDEEIGQDDFVYDDRRLRRRRRCLFGQPHRRRRHDLRPSPARGPAPEPHPRDVVTGDFFVTPPRTVLDLEAALRGVTLGEVIPAVDAFFATAQAGVLSAAPSDFARAIAAAAESA